MDVTGPVPGVYCADGAAECYLSLEESGTSSAAPFVTGGLPAHGVMTSGWHMLASAHAGMCLTRIQRDGMVHDLSRLWTGSFATGLVGNDIGHTGGRLAFRVPQPLRVEAGHARLRWISGRTPDGRVTVEGTILDLAPAGRQLDVELTYSRPWADGRAHLVCIVTRDTGHVRGEHNSALLTRYSRSF